MVCHRASDSLFRAIFVLAACLLASTPTLADEATGRLQGRVIDAEEKPVVGAYVVLCDQASGVPLAAESLKTLSDEVVAGKAPRNMAHAVTDENGRFSFVCLPEGEYRLIAQSWPDAEEDIKGLLEVNGEVIELHGVAEHVRVTAKSGTEEDNVVLRPLGTGMLSMDEDMPNSETLLILSTAPVRADPILGFVGWGGAFSRHIIGANRMPYGKTTVRGLPEGAVHLALFAADSNPGWGAGEVDIRSGKTATAYVPIVAGWSNGQHDPPEELVPLFEEVSTLILDEDFSAMHFLKNNGIALRPEDGLWAVQSQMAKHLEKTLELPSGTKTTFDRFLATVRYLELQQSVKRRAEQAKRRPEMATIEKQNPPTPAREVGYEEAFRDLYTHLGNRYACFELKGIDWEAVGRELLPRAERITTDDDFGVLCLELVARLEDSHAFLAKASHTPPALPFPQWDPGFACLIDDRGKPVVYHVDQEGPAQAGGVRVGMTVVSIGGKTADEAFKQCMQSVSRYIGFSSRRYLRYTAAQWFIRQAERGALVPVTLEDIDGKRHEMELRATLKVRYLPRLPVPIPGIRDSADVSWTRLGNGLGYIYVRRIRRDLIESLDRAIEELADVEGMILDVRGNSGGGFDARRAHRNFIANDQQEPERPRYTGPIALLIDSRCISAGEGWASWFIANDRARLFGETTAGASARKETYTLTNGYYEVTFPVKAYTGFLSRPIERRGLEPDVVIKQNARDLSAGRDTVRAAASQWLLKSPRE